MTKVSEHNLKALKARNEYRLCIDSANAAIRKFYVDDLPELINVSRSCNIVRYYNLKLIDVDKDTINQDR